MQENKNKRGRHENDNLKEWSDRENDIISKQTRQRIFKVKMIIMTHENDNWKDEMTEKTTSCIVYTNPSKNQIRLSWSVISL